MTGHTSPPFKVAPVLSSTVATVLLLGLLFKAADIFLLLFVFVIASLLGFELINKVPPTLHTPLMSGSNAISGITVVGAIMCARNALKPQMTPTSSTSALPMMINQRRMRTGGRGFSDGEGV